MKKQKRIKKVFSSKDQVLHLWANQSQDEARSTNVFFKGKSCYSYGYHYELGRLVTYNGKTVAMINDTGYSNTTSKHICAAYGAVSHLPRLKTTRDLNNVSYAITRRQNEILERLFNHFNKRSFWAGSEKYHLENESWELKEIQEFNSLCDLLGFKDHKINIDSDFINLGIEHIKICIEKEKARNTPEALALKEVKRQKALAKDAEKALQDLLNWKNGGILTDKVKNLDVQKIRVKDNEIQTTRGASVPLTHGLRLLKLIDSGIAKQGDRVGHFSLDAYDSNIAKIGCHKIDLSDARETLKNIQTLTLVDAGA